MKKITTIFTVLSLVLSMVNQSFGQEVTSLDDQSKEYLYDFHMSKHKKLKKTGFILLGAGVAATIGGVLIMENSGLFTNESGAGAILFLAGVMTTSSSIPVFIVSGSHKRKASALVNVGGYNRIDFTGTDPKLVSVGVKIEF
jgi:hypothetical protein